MDFESLCEKCGIQYDNDRYTSCPMCAMEARIKRLVRAVQITGLIPVNDLPLLGNVNHANMCLQMACTALDQGVDAMGYHQTTKALVILALQKGDLDD